jgi:hypothetical protein
MTISRLRLFACILLVAMVFNIFRYQIPQVEYRLFKGYIAKNLCVKKDIPGNCCQGKCFVEKQIKIADETSGDNDNTPKSHNDKKAPNKEIKDFLCSHILTPKLDEEEFLYPVHSGAVKLQGHASAVFVPPKTIFLNRIPGFWRV